MFNDIPLVYLHLILPNQYRRLLQSIGANWGGFGVSSQSQQEGSEDIRNAVSSQDSIKIDDSRTFFRRRSYFKEFLESINNSSKPSLNFIHILLPHVPWEYLPSGRRYVKGTATVDGTTPEERWTTNEWTVLKGNRRYLLQVGFVDKLVGQLLDRLQDQAMFDKSLLVITADHGVSFRPGDYRRPLTQTNFADILPVPLFIKLPYERGGTISDKNVETIDVLPSISDVLRIGLPWKIDGFSALDSTIAERREKIALGGTENKDRMVFNKNLDEKYTSLDRQIRIFGCGPIDDHFYRIGKFSDLIGKHVSTISTKESKDFHVLLPNSESYELVDSTSDPTLSLIFGRVDGIPPRSDSILAISVNDRIEAVTYISEERYGDFSSIVPERSLSHTGSSIGVYLVDSSSGGYTLYRPSSEIRYSIGFSEKGREVLRAPDGNSYPLTKGVLVGNVDSVRFVGDQIYINGWICDFRDTVSPKTILIFLKNKLLHIGAAQGYARGDLVDAFNSPKLASTGFQFDFFRNNLSSFQPSDVRVFALSSDGLATDVDQSSPVNSQTIAGTFSIHQAGRSGKIGLTNRAHKSIAFDADALAGSVDELTVNRNNVQIAGWAADLKNHRPAESILVFTGDSNVTQIFPDIYRFDLAKAYKNSQVAISGFSCNIPIESLGQGRQLTDIRIFALSHDGSTATEFQLRDAVLDRAQEGQRKLDQTRREMEAAVKLLDPGYVIEVNDDGLQKLVSGKGARRMDVSTETGSGSIDSLGIAGGRLFLSGWAADIQGGVPAAKIIVAANGRSVYSFSPMVNRSDLVQAFHKKQIRLSGFEVSLPLGPFGKSLDPLGIRVFALLRSGKEVVELFGKNRAAALARQHAWLRDLAVTKKYHFVQEGSRQYFKNASGGSIPIYPDSLTGNLDGIQDQGDSLYVFGWAAQIAKRQPAEKIFVVIENRDVIVLPVHKIRNDIVTVYNSYDFRYCGFEARISQSELGKVVTGAAVRFFAVAKGGKMASELRYPRNYFNKSIR
jgi:hypothetical protein